MGEVEVAASSLSFRADGLVVSGIYLQPSMSPEDVAATLRSVSASAVVLGDVNARLPWAPGCKRNLVGQGRRRG